MEESGQSSRVDASVLNKCRTSPQSFSRHKGRQGDWHNGGLGLRRVKYIASGHMSRRPQAKEISRINWILLVPF